LALRNLPNEELVRIYDSELVLKLHNQKNLRDTRNILSRFINYLGAYPPSPELAKGFLAQYADRKPRTLYRYTQMVRSFMKWYGEPIDDVKIKVPKTLPPYTEDSDIEKILALVSDKRGYKDRVERDRLLVILAWRTGLRRVELANLRPRDVHGDSLIVRGGKGKKDRLIPLTQDVATRLFEFVKDKNPDERVFGLSPESLGMKVKQLAVRAGLNNFHTHTLRHKFATDVLESGTNVKVLQSLLGHENLNTTEVYLSLTDKELYAAARRLDEHNNRTQKYEGRVESDSEIQNIKSVPIDATSINHSGPWIAALKVMVDPTNLFQAMKPEHVEELQLEKLSVAKDDSANRRLSISNNQGRNSK